MDVKALNCSCSEYPVGEDWRSGKVFSRVPRVDGARADKSQAGEMALWEL